MPLTVTDHQAPVPSPSYQRGQARRGRALHLDALILVTTLHVLALCHLAVRLAHCRCPPPLPAGPGGAPRTYSEETLLLIGLLRTLWRLSYQDMHDWLKQWPALALACLLPGPKTNWVSGAGSNVFSGASSCSFAFSVHPSIAGLPSPRRSL
jgi:hypothetical protein